MFESQECWPANAITMAQPFWGDSGVSLMFAHTLLSAFWQAKVCWHLVNLEPVYGGLSPYALQELSLLSKAEGPPLYPATFSDPAAPPLVWYICFWFCSAFWMQGSLVYLGFKPSRYQVSQYLESRLLHFDALRSLGHIIALNALMLDQAEKT